ncbi:MORN repeat-containing protein [Leptospira ilyithenensis]|uniref:Membrane-binding protein n=1 Tax=Leptospira ilyithenensis TaxID=2484901 RepID=A0A4R9LNM1_9LEPT|nr:hypothetical protein [Leptospira ilyithenensis]TGN08327.1 hypothetical protein EHS11_15575 [Leptospira ilyithenensis]
MKSLFWKRTLSLLIFGSFFYFISCSSTPKEGEANKEGTEQSSRSVENIDVQDPNKQDSNEKKFGCVEGDCVNGIGKYIYENGDIYQGSFKNDQREGQGNFVYTDGEKFSGIYKEDKRSGPGEYQFKNGDKYIGEFKDGGINGKGTYSFKDGKSLNGDFSNDGMEGTGTLIEDGKPRNCKIQARKLLCE